MGGDLAPTFDNKRGTEPMTEQTVQLVADEVAHLVEERDIAERLARRILTVLAEQHGGDCEATWQEWVHGQSYECSLPADHFEDHQATVTWARRG